MNKKALGKGLSAIISSAVSPEDLEKVVDKNRIIEIDIKLIKSNPDQPRTSFNNDEINELAESIKSVGLIQPVIVREKGNDYYIVAGERRLRAAKVAGLKKIKAIIIQPSEEENLSIALIENLQRKDLDPIDEANAYRVLVERFKLKQQDIAKRVGKDRATIANSLRLLNLEKEIQAGLSEGSISVGHAKVLLSMPEQKQAVLYREIINKALSVRALEKMLDEKTGRDHKTKKSRSKDVHVKKIEEELAYILGTKVEIKHSKNRGRIEIHYYSLDDFDRIMGILK
jgi:ParB family chromosome partitioning protein